VTGAAADIPRAVSGYQRVCLGDSNEEFHLRSEILMSASHPTVLMYRPTKSIKEELERITDDLFSSFPPAEQLSAAGRREIIARYSAVLEGNFIYWMTGAYIAAKSNEARSIILDNLLEEVRDCHPGMLRRFVMAAHASPTREDALAVYPNLCKVRLFIGRLSPAPILAMMAFFEGFIQRFMPYLADLARRQGSEEQEYTDVHSGCDIVHSQELFRALDVEIRLTADSRKSADYLLEGVYLLQSLILSMVPDNICSMAQQA
jgi:hypothetical protein